MEDYDEEINLWYGNDTKESFAVYAQEDNDKMKKKVDHDVWIFGYYLYDIIL